MIFTKIKVDRTYMEPTKKDKITYYFILPFISALILITLFYMVSNLGKYPLQQAELTTQIGLIIGLIISAFLIFFGKDYPWMQKWLKWKKRNH